MFVMVSIWGLRLAAYIFIRHKGEDFRYKEFRQAWESVNQTWFPYLIAFFQVFMLQAVLALLVNCSALYALSPLQTATSSGSTTWAWPSGLSACSSKS